MSKVKLTISVTDEVASYLRSRGNASAVVSDAVREYRARELEAELARAYREDATEAEQLNAEWTSVDAEVRE